MPPRYAYWTIIAGGLPTAFRTAEREDLLPTFRRIKEKHPDAEMKYFARGRLWQSPDEAKAEAKGRRAAASQRQGTRSGPSRGRDWRPGGDHRDPRLKFKDAKKRRNLERRKDRFARRQKPGVTRPPGDLPAHPVPRAARTRWRERGSRADAPTSAGAPRSKGRHGAPKAAATGRPASRRRPSGSGNGPAGPPDRHRNRRGPVKDRRGRS